MDYLRFHGTCGGVPARQGIEQKNVHDMESSTRIRNTIQDPKFRNSRSRRSSNPDERCNMAQQCRAQPSEAAMSEVMAEAAEEEEIKSAYPVDLP